MHDYEPRMVHILYVWVCMCETALRFSTSSIPSDEDHGVSLLDRYIFFPFELPMFLFSTVINKKEKLH